VLRHACGRRQQCLARLTPFVPLQIYGSKDVTTANLNAAVQTGAKYLLGFHEPELSSGANLPVQVCSLAPPCWQRRLPWLMSQVRAARQS
jgi:hypothetical protein